MDKKHALIWAGWYPQNENDYSGIFIKKHIEIIANHLNVNIHVFSIKHQKHLWWYKKIIIKESFGNVHYWYIPAFFPLKLVGYFIIPFIEARRLQKKAKHIDYFHLHVSYPYAVFTFLLRFLKIDNWLLTEHWSGYTKYDNSFVKLNKLMQKGIAMVLKRMNKISVVSNFLNKELIGRFPFLANKIAITYNVINFPKKKHSIEIKDIFCLLTISSLKNNPKNLSFLLRVMAEVVKEYSAIKLDIYGDGQDKQTLVQLADELGLLNHHVFFKGKFNNAEVEKIYSHYHAFILLSKFETFSIVTAEALAHGLPVIVTKCGAPEEYVMNELNGYLVEINNLEQTKSAVFSLIRNYSKFDATTIQNTVKEKFSKEKVIEAFRHLYDVE